MSSDSSLPLVILVLSLPLFFGITAFGSALGLWERYAGPPWSASEAPTPALRRLILSHDRTALLVAIVRLALLLSASASLASWVIPQTWSHWPHVVLSSALLLVVLAVLHVAARALGRSHARPILLTGAMPLYIAGWLFSPVLWLSERLGFYVLAWRSDAEPGTAADSPSDGQEDDVPVEEEVRRADPEERRMIRSILDLEGIAVREVMVPRVDIIAVDVGTPLQEVGAFMAEEGHSRLPVYQESIDTILGVVYARDVLQRVTDVAQSGMTLEAILRPAMFIPDTLHLDQLLREMQERRTNIAIVVDEYGGTEGLVTMEDVLEEIVGEIEDEFQKVEPDIVHVGEGEAVVDGRMLLEEFNEALGASVGGDEGFYTLGGLIAHRLGRIPAAGDTLEADGLTLHVLSISGRRVRKVQVRKETGGDSRGVSSDDAR
ncbi:MAG: HlyC/CorC family transporter [Chloroflexi bacterium]|nr:HlyC/CorC family transporter [Chloroflexota bacterium]